MLSWFPILGDITNSESLPEFRGVQTLLISVGLDRAAGFNQRQVYVDGLRNLIHHLPDRPQHVIYVSSTSVYGQHQGEIVDANSPTEPTTENGRVCLDAEHLLRDLIPTSTIIRSAGIYGPNRLLLRIESLKSGAVFNGEPDAWLNLIHVDDLAAAVLACESPAARGKTFLASDNQPVARRDFYDLLAKTAGAPAPQFELLRDISSSQSSVENAIDQPQASDASTAVSPFRNGPTPNQRSATRHGTNQLNKRCSNRHLSETLNWSPSYPTYREGLAAIFSPSDAS